MTQKRVGYHGKSVFVGLDVHKEFYQMVCRCNKVVVKKARVIADPEQTAASLCKWFEGAKIHSAYEAGFSGFGLHRVLIRHGIKNIVINPASVAQAPGDRVKTDDRDADKFSEQLEAGQLEAIYVPSESQEYDRQLTRTREQVVKKRACTARQIKSKLHYFGLMKRDDNRLITNRYLKEIENLRLDQTLKFSFGLLISDWRYQTRQLIEVRQKMQEQAKKSRDFEEIYRSVPGIGQVTARVFSNELGDLSRFPNVKALYQYLGFTPWEDSSGSRIRRGHISRQGSSRLRYLLVEAAWRAINKDANLREKFDRIAKTRGSKRAIVAVARNLIGRIRACFNAGSFYVKAPMSV